MSGRIRPSARKKTLHNVMCSALSETDKKCIEEVFETFEQLKAEIEEAKQRADEWHREAELTAEKLDSAINAQETLQKALAEKIEESENQSQNLKILYSDCRTLQLSFDNLKDLYKAEKARAEKAKEKSVYFAKELQKAKAEIERLQELVSNANKLKVKAIKEFATQVRGAFYYEFDEIIPSIMADKIDTLVKEMVGEKEWSF